jgi:hypothetical protein
MAGITAITTTANNPAVWRCDPCSLFLVIAEISNHQTIVEAAKYWLTQAH